MSINGFIFRISKTTNVRVKYIMTVDSKILIIIIKGELNPRRSIFSTVEVHFCQNKVEKDKILEQKTGYINVINQGCLVTIQYQWYEWNKDCNYFFMDVSKGFILRRNPNFK